jgi:hypothetical protein
VLLWRPDPRVRQRSGGTDGGRPTRTRLPRVVLMAWVREIDGERQNPNGQENRTMDIDPVERALERLDYENSRLRDVLQRMSNAAVDSAGEFRAIGQDAAASFAESVAKVTREALAEG